MILHPKDDYSDLQLYLLTERPQLSLSLSLSLFVFVCACERERADFTFLAYQGRNTLFVCELSPL